MQQVLSTTTSADSTSSVGSRPSATRSPARRSESCSFIWHPKVRMWNVRAMGPKCTRRPRSPRSGTRSGAEPRVRASGTQRATDVEEAGLATVDDEALEIGAQQHGPSPDADLGHGGLGL